MERLDGAKLRDALTGCTIGREIIVLEETTSTNDSILHRAATTAEGLVVFAERQTRGRGQRNNRWESAADKGLWLSILLRPLISIAESPRLTAWAASVVSDVITKEFSLTATVKPPNDVYVDQKKVAGVLVEMRAQENAPYIAILGIGINVNQGAEDFSEDLRFRASSLAMLLGQQVDRHRLAIALLRELDRTYLDFRGL